MVKCTIFKPLSEREYENVLDEWEAKSRGSGMHSKILENLLIHGGALRVRQTAMTFPVDSISWLELNSQVAHILFPFSRYRRDLEKEIEEENKYLLVEEAIVLLARYKKRHQDLCIRWGQTNTLFDDRLKDALLAKLPPEKVTPCLTTKDFHTFSYNDFVLHCRMDTSALKVGKEAQRRKHPQVSHKHFVPPITPKPKGSKKTAPSDYRCFNCGALGHYANQCLEPKVKCTCTRLQHDGPMGRTRTRFLRMTHKGIYLDLVDEATKKALFETMRIHLEGQEKAYEKDPQVEERHPTLSRTSLRIHLLMKMFF